MSDRIQAEKTSGMSSLFDLRLILALLFVVYGLVLTVMGLLPQGADAMAKTGDWNVNLWTGIIMLLAAVVFGVWTRLRPLVIKPEDLPGDADSAKPSGT